MSVLDRFDWQKRELAEHRDDPKRAIFASPRLGKSLVGVDYLEYWNPARSLVTAPLSVCPMWHEMCEDRGWQVVNLYSGSAAKRWEQLFLYGKKPHVVAVGNYDFLKANPERLIRWNPLAVLGDESHLVKGAKSKRGRAFRRLAWQAEYVRLLTGTPVPNHYGDLWGQMVCLDKTAFGTSYEKFADRYLIRDTMFPSRVLGHRNTEELVGLIRQYASFYRRSEEFGPDHWQVVTRKIQLPPAVRKMYDKLAKDWVLEDWGVDASHVLKRLIRLHQIACGYTVAEDGTVTELHTAKLDAVMADLDEIVESEEKAVLFHQFRWESQRYADECRRKFPGTPVYVLSGDTPVGDRDVLLRSFRSDRGSAIAVVQTQAGGVGVSFAEATHALFVSRGFSFTDDEQARDRIYKPGCARCVTYYEVEKSTEGFIAEVLASKKDIHGTVANADRHALAYGYIRGR